MGELQAVRIGGKTVIDSNLTEIELARLRGRVQALEHQHEAALVNVVDAITAIETGSYQAAVALLHSAELRLCSKGVSQTKDRRK